MSDNYIGRSPEIAVPAIAIFNGGYLYGGTMSNFAGDLVNDISVAAGECRDSANAFDIRWPAAITGKQLDAVWVAGSGVGMRDASPLANGTWHIFAIRATDTGLGDILASTSLTPALPTGYNAFRRIGSILREAATIVPFSQDGDEFLRSTAILDLNATVTVTTAETRTLSVPTGIKVGAKFNFFFQGGSTSGVDFNILLSSFDVADAVPATAAAPLSSMTSHTEADRHSHSAAMQIRTNTSGQIRSRVLDVTGNNTLRIATTGWIDSRGQTA